MDLALEPLNSVCPIFFPSLGMVEPVGIGCVGPLEPREWGCWNPEGGSRRSSVRRKHQRDSKKSGGYATPLNALNSVTDTPWVHQDLYTLAKLANSSTGHKSTGWGKRESRGWGYYFVTGWYHMEGSAQPNKDDIYRMGEQLNTGILAAVPSGLSPEPPTPDSTHTTIVHSILSLLEHRVSDCEILCIGPLRGCPCLYRTSVSPCQENSCCFL